MQTFKQLQHRQNSTLSQSQALSQRSRQTARRETAFEEAKQVFQSWRNKTAALEAKSISLESKCVELEKQEYAISINLREIASECAQLQEERDNRKEQLQKLPAKLELFRNKLEYRKARYSKFDGGIKKLQSLLQSLELEKHQVVVTKIEQEYAGVCEKLKPYYVKVPSGLQETSERLKKQSNDLQLHHQRVQIDVSQNQFHMKLKDTYKVLKIQLEERLKLKNELREAAESKRTEILNVEKELALSQKLEAQLRLLLVSKHVGKFHAEKIRHHDTVNELIKTEKHEMEHIGELLTSKSLVDKNLFKIKKQLAHWKSMTYLAAVWKNFVKRKSFGLWKKIAGTELKVSRQPSAADAPHGSKIDKSETSSLDESMDKLSIKSVDELPDKSIRNELHTSRKSHSKPYKAQISLKESVSRSKDSESKPEASVDTNKEAPNIGKVPGEKSSEFSLSNTQPAPRRSARFVKKSYGKADTRPRDRRKKAAGTSVVDKDKDFKQPAYKTKPRNSSVTKDKTIQGRKTIEPKKVEKKNQDGNTRKSEQNEKPVTERILTKTKPNKFEGWVTKSDQKFDAESFTKGATDRHTGNHSSTAQQNPRLENGDFGNHPFKKRGHHDERKSPELTNAQSKKRKSTENKNTYSENRDQPGKCVEKNQNECIKHSVVVAKAKTKPKARRPRRRKRHTQSCVVIDLFQDDIYN